MSSGVVMMVAAGLWLAAAPALGPLVSVEVLRKASDKVVIVDARDSAAYEAGHIAGAVSLPWVDLAQMPKSPRALAPDKLAGILTSRGIPHTGWVVVYGDGSAGFGEEGRLYWSLSWLGQRTVGVLDGGLPAWKRAGLPLSTEVSMRRGGKFIEAPDTALRIEKPQLAAKVSAGQVTVLDVREPDEYAGAQKYGEPRGGHIPGAINVPWKTFLSEGGAVLSKPELKRVLTDRKVPLDKPVVVYCTGGVRSGFAFFALRLAGVPAVSNYDGSFWEWSADAALPVEK